MLKRVVQFIMLVLLATSCTTLTPSQERGAGETRA